MSLLFLANEYISILVEAVYKYQVKHGVSISLPRVHRIDQEDGGVSLEWMWPDQRVGIFLDPDPKESGWYCITAIRAGADQTYGTLEEFSADKVAEFIWTKKYPREK